MNRPPNEHDRTQNQRENRHGIKAIDASLSATGARHSPTSDVHTIQMARSSARSLATDLKQRQARIRRAAVRRTNSTAPVPPLIRTFSTRGAVEQQIKLALLCNWIAGSAGGGFGQTAVVQPAEDVPLRGPHSAGIDEIELCELLGLACATGPERSASFKKLKRYFDHVDSMGLIEVSDDYTRFRLLNDDGSGAPYTDPGSKDRNPTQDGYFRVPVDFFRNGWLSLLSGTGRDVVPDPPGDG